MMLTRTVTNAATETSTTISPATSAASIPIRLRRENRWSASRSDAAGGPRPGVTAGSRSTYPTPRTVWISRGSPSASVLRRR